MKTLIATAALAVSLALPAWAQQNRNCGPRDLVMQRLADGFGETRQAVALGANNSVVEILASEETGTWTITVTSPRGLTCLVASGQAFELVSEELPAKGDDL